MFFRNFVSLFFVAALLSLSPTNLFGIVSDDFSGSSLNTGVWTFVNPLGDGSVIATGTSVAIHVPANLSHDIWLDNKGPRLMQSAANTDFEIEVKIDSAVEKQFQIQGLVVENNADNYVIFQTYSDGVDVRLFSASFASGTGKVRVNKSIAAGGSYYLRVTRTGNSWVIDYSYDGSSWLSGTNFNHTMTVTSVGVFAANHGTGNDIPSHTGNVDYFFNTTAPIDPEDGDPNRHTVVGLARGCGSVDRTPESATYQTGESVSLTATPSTGWIFAGWNEAGGDTTNPLPLTVTGNIVMNAIFEFDPAVPSWTHLTSDANDLPVPAINNGQIDAKIVDLDQNGENDLVLTAWNSSESIVWYRREAGVYSKYIVTGASPTNLTHCHNFRDIDGDGDVDLIFGDAGEGNRMYWWENPYPNYDPNVPWIGRLVRDEGGNMYHDSIWGDFDGDGVDELMSWNQKGQQLLFFEVPPDPNFYDIWPAVPVFTWPSTNPDDEYDGAAVADINLDGKIDLVGGGGWLEHLGGTNFVHHLLDDSLKYTRVASGQLIPGGRPEIVFAHEVVSGPLLWYEWKDNRWVPHAIEAEIPRTHTLQIGDINGDGRLDIMTGEMGEWKPFDLVPDNPNARIRVFYGSGTGYFSEQLINSGQGVLAGQLGDVDGDGDLDIVSKPFGQNIPLIEIWINDGVTPSEHLMRSDITLDCFVDLMDYVFLASQYLCNGGECSDADVNNDGQVDVLDLMILTQEWLEGNL